MTPEEMLEDIENCTGPCGEMCLSCPESRYLREIHDALKTAIDERNMYKHMVEIERIMHVHPK